MKKVYEIKYICNMIISDEIVIVIFFLDIWVMHHLHDNNRRNWCSLRWWRPLLNALFICMSVDYFINSMRLYHNNNNHEYTYMPVICIEIVLNRTRHTNTYTAVKIERRSAIIDLTECQQNNNTSALLLFWICNTRAANLLWTMANVLENSIQSATFSIIFQVKN